MTMPRMPAGSLIVWLAVLYGTSALDYAYAEPYAYVPNEGSGTISIVDTANDTVTGEIRVGGRPRGIASDPARKILYITDQPSSALKVIDAASGRITGEVQLGKSPEGVYLSSD